MGLQNFQVLQPLGKGAFASVFKVLRHADNKSYALKKVNIENMSQKELDDTLNEIRFLASFKHPRLVRWFETFLERDDTELCIVMEFCGCGDLSQKIERYKKRRQYIDERVIWVYLIQILEGLRSLHEKNILHRDLKAANCFLAEDGSIKIGDMNVSKVMREGLLKTQIGTPYYMSPEIWSNRAYNASSDIWSLGCLVYELCALRPPFLGDSLPTLKTAVLTGTYPPIPSVYSQELAGTVARLLQLNPRERPTAREALMLPEVVARKCLVKNAMTEADDHTIELMPSIRVSKMSSLASKLPKPAYPDCLPAPAATQPEAPPTTVQVPMQSAPAAKQGPSTGEESNNGTPDNASQASSAPQQQQHVQQDGAAGAPQQQQVMPKPSGRRSSNFGSSEEYNRRAGAVAEQAQERLRGLMAQGETPRRASVMVSPLGAGIAPIATDAGTGEKGANVTPRKGPLLSGFGLRSPVASPGNNGSATPTGQKTPGGAPLERQGSVRKVLSDAQEEVAASDSSAGRFNPFRQQRTSAPAKAS